MRPSLLLAPILLTACVAPQSAAPPPRVPIAPPPVAAPPPPPTASWQDGPAAPGIWTWVQDAEGAAASFGIAGQVPAFVARCDRARRTITLSVPATPAASLTIQTSDGARTFPAGATAATPPRIGATVAAADGFLDRIAFSRGRFRVQPAGGAAMVIPAWPEFARTVEDCRP